MPLPTFEQYALADATDPVVRTKSEYTTAPGLSIYARRSLRYPGIIVLANITAKPKRKGHFTRFLEDWSPRLPLEVEQPLNPHLLAFLERLRWRVTGQLGDMHVYNQLACDIVDATDIERRQRLGL